jgi:hypothetical protein
MPIEDALERRCSVHPDRADPPVESTVEPSTDGTGDADQIAAINAIYAPVADILKSATYIDRERQTTPHRPSASPTMKP